jgi:hypothetical protein
MFFWPEIKHVTRPDNYFSREGDFWWNAGNIGMYC